MRRTLLLVGMGILTCLSAAAQVRSAVVANIPFEFRAGARTMPAGRHTIISEGQMGGRLILESAGSGGRFIVSALPADRQMLKTFTTTSKSPKSRVSRTEGRTLIMFSRGAEGRELMSVWNGNHQRGYQVAAAVQRARMANANGSR